LLNIRRDFFSRTGLTIVGLLLTAVIVLTAYSLWDIALRRWFG
jgi:hypothetical protein